MLLMAFTVSLELGIILFLSADNVELKEESPLIPSGFSSFAASSKLPKLVCV